MIESKCRYSLETIFEVYQRLLAVILTVVLLSTEICCPQKENTQLSSVTYDTGNNIWLYSY